MKILPLALSLALATTPALARAADPLVGLAQAAHTQQQSETMAVLREGVELSALLKEAGARVTNAADARFFAQWAKQHHVSPHELVKLNEAEREGEGWAIRLKPRTPLLHLQFRIEGAASVTVNGHEVKGHAGEAARMARDLAKLLAGERLGGWPELVPSAHAVEPATMMVAAALVGAVGFGLAEYMLPTAVSKYFAGALIQCERDRGHHRPYEGSAAAGLVRALNEQGITAASFPEKKPGRCGSETLARAMAATPEAKRSGDTEAGCTQIAWFIDCAGKFEAASTKATVNAAPANTSMGDR